MYFHRPSRTPRVVKGECQRAVSATYCVCIIRPSVTTGRVHPRSPSWTRLTRLCPSTAPLMVVPARAAKVGARSMVVTGS